MRFEKRFPSLTLTLSRAKIDRCRLSERRVDASSFSSSASLLASLTLANPSWIYSKERVTNDPLRKFSRLLLPRILFFGIVNWHEKKGKGFSRFKVSRIRGEWEGRGIRTVLSLLKPLSWRLPSRSSVILARTPRIHRGNKCWKHSGGRVSIPWKREKFCSLAVPRKGCLMTLPLAEFWRMLQANRADLRIKVDSTY